MPTEDYLPSTVLGFEYGKSKQREEQGFALDVQKAEQDLYSKSLEIQDFIDAADSRKAVYKAKQTQAESDVKLQPLRDREEKQALQLGMEKRQMEMDVFDREVRAQDLFHLNAENYNDQYASIPQETKNELGLTGKWQDDGFKVTQYRTAAINTAAHMRAVQVSAAKAAAKGSTNQASGIKFLKAQEEATHNMLGNDNIYNSLDSGSAASYLANITYLASDLYQRQIDKVKSRELDVSQILPYNVIMNQVKQLADKHVTDNAGGLWSRFMNNAEFNTQDFQAEVGAMYGLAIPKSAIEDMQATGEAQAAVDITEGPQPRVPPEVKQAMAHPIATRAVREYRSKHGIPANVPDFAIFNGLVEAGYLMPDGSLGSEKKKMAKKKKGGYVDIPWRNPFPSVTSEAEDNID